MKSLLMLVCVVSLAVAPGCLGSKQSNKNGKVRTERSKKHKRKARHPSHPHGHPHPHSIAEHHHHPHPHPHLDGPDGHHHP